jgi:AraC family transcriptional regulator
LATRLLEEFHREDDASALAIEGLMLELLADSSRQRAGTLERRCTAWLVRARESLNAHFVENLSLKEIAAAVGVHPVHLARTFHAQYRLKVVRLPARVGESNPGKMAWLLRFMRVGLFLAHHL